MLETLLNKMEALLNEHASAAVLREHLALLRERIGALERDNDSLRLQMQQTQAHVDDQKDKEKDKVERFANDNPEGLRCDGCGSVDLRRTGSRADPTFGRLGIKQALMTCRLCAQVSAFTLHT